MGKKIISFILGTILFVSTGLTAFAAPAINSHITVNSFDPKVDYMAEIKKCVEDGSGYAMLLGAIYEKQRNLKIDKQGLKYGKTSYFTTYSSADAIRNAIEEDNKPKPTYTEEELYWLSRAIYAEAGCDWIPDWVQMAVGSVILNRVKSNRYPNSITDVLWQPGQYECVVLGGIYQTPSAKCIKNAKFILENGSTLPEGVLGQSAFPSGPIHSSYYDSILDITIYFFYV